VISQLVMAPKKKTNEKKAVAAKGFEIKKAPLKGKAPKAEKKEVSPLIERRPRNFGIGRDIPPKRDLTRFVRWPKYVRLQRQRRVLYGRLRIPPAINQFTRTVDKNTATNLFKILDKYKPETAKAKKERLLKVASAKAEGKKEDEGKKPLNLKYGINHIAALVESKKASLVVIAHDVDPIELVLWLPALCHTNNVPYCIVKGKARLGQLVHKKTATAVALTQVEKGDLPTYQQLLQTFRENYNDRYQDTRKTWGKPHLGAKSRANIARKEKAVRAAEGSKAAKQV